MAKHIESVENISDDDDFVSFMPKNNDISSTINVSRNEDFSGNASSSINDESDDDSAKLGAIGNESESDESDDSDLNKLLEIAGRFLSEQKKTADNGTKNKETKQQQLLNKTKSSKQKEQKKTADNGTKNKETKQQQLLNKTKSSKPKESRAKKRAKITDDNGHLESTTSAKKPRRSGRKPKK